MDQLLPLAGEAGALLKQRQQTIAIAESSAGGLISAALLAVPGASAYFLGGGVIYTRHARLALLGIDAAAMEGMRPSTEPYARLLAGTVKQNFAATWGLGETGATGPTGNSYGDAPGHACLAIAGPVEQALTLETRNADRVMNMRLFARRALELLVAALKG